ncbi:MAG: sugar ABC transporter permease [Chloroflexi bacterium]|nr:sugar ABC transporter permease [Chloroflexota bacterium]
MSNAEQGGVFARWWSGLTLDIYMQIAGMALIFPAALLLLALLIAPFTYIIWSSFIEKGGMELSFANYEWLLGPAFWPSLKNSLIIGVGSIALEILAAIPLAILVNQNLYGRGMLRALVTLPWAVPTISVAAAFLWLSNTNYGLFNQIGLATGFLKLPLAFLGDPYLALPAVVLAHAWKGLPLAFIVIFAALQSLPPEHLEAAKIDGAWRMAQLRHIILPHLKTAIGLAAVLSGIYNFALFDLTFLLTGGGPAGTTMTLPMLEYNQMYRSLNIGRASAVGVTIFLVGILALSLLFLVNTLDRKKRGMR